MSSNKYKLKNGYPFRFELLFKVNVSDSEVQHLLSNDAVSQSLLFKVSNQGSLIQPLLSFSAIDQSRSLDVSSSNINPGMQAAGRVLSEPFFYVAQVKKTEIWMVRMRRWMDSLNNF